MSSVALHGTRAAFEVPELLCSYRLSLISFSYCNMHFFFGKYIVNKAMFNKKKVNMRNYSSDHQDCCIGPD